MVFWKIALSRSFIPRVVQMRSFCDISAKLPCTQYADVAVRGVDVLRARSHDPFVYALGTTQNLGLQTKMGPAIAGPAGPAATPMCILREMQLLHLCKSYSISLI